MYKILFLFFALCSTAHADFVTGYLLGSGSCDRSPRVTVTAPACLIMVTDAASGAKFMVNTTVIDDAIPLASVQGGWLSTALPARTHIHFVTGGSRNVLETPEQVRELSKECVK